MSTSSLYCEHANECPQTCPCPSDCACKDTMCKERPISPPATMREALDIAVRLGRAEKENEQLKASNEWLLKQLRAKEPWVSVDDGVTKNNEEMLKKSVWELNWSVRATSVIERRLHPTKGLTVADLVAIPPKEWMKDRSCGMLILREMNRRFVELGVEWPGEWPRL